MSKRGVDIGQERTWVAFIEKEDKLRLRWFSANESKLVSDTPLKRQVSPELRGELRESRKIFNKNREFFPNPKPDEPEPPLVDPDAMVHVMKPVDPSIRQLIYSGANKDGRVNYLKARVRLIPEERYYFPEAASFVYGWKMWDNAKTRTGVRLGRSQIINDTFYRRRGVGRDPDWYTSPASLNPTACGW